MILQEISFDAIYSILFTFQQQWAWYVSKTKICLCHKLIFCNPFMFAIWRCTRYDISNLDYLIQQNSYFEISKVYNICKDIRVRKSEFAKKTKFLCFQKLFFENLKTEGKPETPGLPKKDQTLMQTKKCGKELSFCHKLWFFNPYIFTRHISNYEFCWSKDSKF